VAIAILALSLSALMSSSSTGLRGVAAIDDQLQARLLAQSVMAEWSRDRTPPAERLEGRFDKFAWSLSITPFEEGGMPHRPSRPWNLHRLTVTVSWPPGRQIDLQTLRMLRAHEQPDR
jgi:hypothetical protein